MVEEETETRLVMEKLSRDGSPRSVEMETSTIVVMESEEDAMRETSLEAVREVLGLNITDLHNLVLPLEDCDFLQEMNISMGNFTCIKHAPSFTSAAQVRGIVLAVMAVLSLVGNTATIISIAREKRRSRSTVYTLIHHLSVADLFVTFACLTTESIWNFTVQWLAGNVVCKLVKFTQMFSLYLSTFILVLIGVDRFTAVRYPMRRSDTQRQCGYGIVFVWILSGIFSLPQLLVFHVVRGPFYEDFYQCVTYGKYTAPWQEQLYTIFSLICMFVLPLFILMITYVSTFVTLQKSERMFKSERTTLGATCPEFNRRRLLRKAKMRALRISVVIVLAFVICWTPYYTMMVIHMFWKVDESVSEELNSAIFFFGMSNSLVNPIIYGAFHLCRCHSRKSSFNLIIINGGGSNNLRYRLSGRASTRSTTCRSTATDLETSLVNVGEGGVRYSFRRRSSNRHRAAVTSRAGSFDASVDEGYIRNSVRYGRRSKGLLGHRPSPRSSLNYGTQERFSPLNQCVSEEDEDENFEWQGLSRGQTIVTSNGRTNSVKSWARTKKLNFVSVPTEGKEPVASEHVNSSTEAKRGQLQHNHQQCPCNTYDYLKDGRQNLDTEL